MAAEPSRINITICGGGGTGKSSITLRLVRGAWTDEYDPTIEDFYSTTRTVDGKPYVLHITDTAGQEEYRFLSSPLSRQSDAFLLVYDITAGASLREELPRFLEEIAIEADAREDEGETRPVCVVAGNKVDLREKREVGAEEGLRWSRENKCAFMETSARECVNIEETFRLIVRRVEESRRQLEVKKQQEQARHAAALARGPHHADSFSRTRPLSPPVVGANNENQASIAGALAAPQYSTGTKIKHKIITAWKKITLKEKRQQRQLQEAREMTEKTTPAPAQTPQSPSHGILAQDDAAIWDANRNAAGSRFETHISAGKTQQPEQSQEGARNRRSMASSFREVIKVKEWLCC